MTPSCSSCPSFLKPAEAVDTFRKNTGAPMCARYSTVLGRPGVSPTQGRKLLEHFASKCDAFGQPRPPSPVDHRGLSVMLPDPAALTKSVPSAEKEACKSCAMCVNFVRDDIVARELGWTAGLCGAKGKLIFSNRQVYEARGCDYRQYGQTRTTTGDLHMLPEYEDAFAPLDPMRAFIASRENFTEPAEWVTEREVTTEEAAAGIGAWRRIIDPNGSGNEVFMPVYRTDSFSEDERKLIPKTGEDSHPELYVDHFGGVYVAAVCWTELDETPALWGEAGTGKTELFRHLAWLMNMPFRRMSITASTELDDLAGKMHYTPEQGTYFKYGRLPDAWMKPGVICIDEPNTGPADVWQFLRPLTDNSKQLVLDMNEGEALDRHPDSYLGLAMNPAWSPLNVGALPIGDADANRLFHVYVELPPESLEKEIIRARVKLDGWEISSEQLDTLMRIAEEIRGVTKQGTLPITWAIRPQIKVARALRWFDPLTAYSRAVGDYLEPEAREAILDLVRAHV